jgi:hypothetical protein
MIDYSIVLASWAATGDHPLQTATCRSEKPDNYRLRALADREIGVPLLSSLSSVY